MTIPIPNCPQPETPIRERAWADGQRPEPKYTAKEVFAEANRHGDHVADMLNAFAERIEADESAVGEYIANVDKYGGVLWRNGPPAHGTRLFTHPPAQAAQVDPAWWVWRRGGAHPPAQAAQGETACPKCGATNPEDAATRCCPDGDSCPGCEEPLAQAWDRKAAQPAQPVDIAAIREVIAHLRSFRSNTPPTWAHLDDAADKLAAALQEKGNG